MMLDRRQNARDKIINGGVAAKIIRWRDNFVSFAFNPERPYELPASDLDERVRKSEQKKQQLQRRIDDLLGGR